MTLLEASLQVHLLLTPLCLLQTSLGVLLPIRLCITVHDTHVVNTVCPIVPEVPDQKVSLLFRGLWWRFPWCGAVTGSGRLGFRPPPGATLVYEGVVAYVRGGKCPARQIRDPLTELTVTRRDKATPLAVKGMADGKPGVAAVAVFGEVWGLEATAQEGGISPFLRSQLRPIYCLRLHRQPGPSLCCPLQLAGDYQWGPGDGPGGVSPGLVLPLGPAGLDFGLFKAQPCFMRGSLHT